MVQDQLHGNGIMQVSELLVDLLAEQAVLDGVLSGLSDSQWSIPTASPRWDVTQRRALSDTSLSVTGDAAHDWMMIAQVFAGAPTTGPQS